MWTHVQLPDYSGRTLTRLGRAANWSFLISIAVTLQDSRDKDLRFWSGFRWWSPEFDTREFDTFRETKAVRPEISSKDLSVRLPF